MTHDIRPINPSYGVAADSDAYRDIAIPRTVTPPGFSFVHHDARVATRLDGMGYRYDVSRDGVLLASGWIRVPMHASEPRLIDQAELYVRVAVVAMIDAMRA